MSALQLAVLAGALVAGGLVVLGARFLPATPDLRDALSRLDTTPRDTTPVKTAAGVNGWADRAGLAVQRRAPTLRLSSVPAADLAVLRRSSHRHIGEKVTFAVVGFLFPVIVNLLLLLIGVHIAFALPLVLSLALAAGMFFLPDLTVRSDAETARREFRRGLASYIDLVALERAAGSGTTQALTQAAEVGDSWVFRRIREQLVLADLSSTRPWDGIANLGTEVGIPELGDLAQIMRISGQESASVAEHLAARASSMRSALLNDDLAKANAATERMTAPVSVLALVFMTLLLVPLLLRLVTT